MSIDLQPGDDRIGKEPPYVGIYFWIGGGSFDHEELTRRLGIEPTKAWRVGDLKRPDQVPSPRVPARHKEDGWSLQLGSRPAIETGPLFLELLDLTAAAPPALIRETLRDMALEAWVMLGVIRHDEDFWPVMEVPIEFIEWMATVGAPLEMDLIA